MTARDRIYAQLALLAYNETDLENDLTHAAGVVLISDGRVDVTDRTELAVYQWGYELIFAVAGTNEAEDWLTNCSIWQSPPRASDRVLADEEWHAGFLRQWGSMKLYTVHWIHRQRKRDAARKITLLGHSQAGSITAIGAYMLSRDNEYSHIPIDHVSWGEPRSFNPPAALDFSLRLPHARRYYHPRDPVPRHPFAFWGYRHVGQPLKTAPSMWSWPPCSVKYHAMELYADA